MMNKNPQLLIILYILITILCLASCVASSREKTELELHGAGTSEAPYRIFSAEDLFQIAIMINSGDEEASRAYYVLENDIDLKSQEWTPIGYYHPNFAIPCIFFQGNWDGNGYTISNLRIALSEEQLKDDKGHLKTMSIGFFSLLGDNAVVKNLNIKNMDVIKGSLNDGYGYYVAAGALAGMNQGGYIENCHVTEFAMVLEEKDREIGGLVGVNSGDVENSSVHYNIEINDLSIIYYGRAYIGGFCGLNSGQIKGSVSEGIIRGIGKNSTWHIGGFVGVNAEGTVENCQSSGEIEGMAAYAVIGGMCGHNNGKIEKSKSRNIITATGNDSNIGEFIGENSGTTIDCTCYMHSLSGNPLVGEGNDDTINIIHSDE